jgi:hypothetical protein
VRSATSVDMHKGYRSATGLSARQPLQADGASTAAV